MALIAGAGLFALSILAAALSRLVAAEIEAWGPAIVCGLIKLAVGSLPEKHRERFGEEWQSHVDEVPGLVGKTVTAVGFLLAAHNMALPARHAEEINIWLDKLAQIRDSHSKVIMVVEAIRGEHNLASDDGLTSLVDELSFQLSTMKELDDRLAGGVIAYASVPPTIFSNALSWRRRRLVREELDRASLCAKRISELSDTVIGLMDQRRKKLFE
jgi:hypothetical protein